MAIITEEILNQGKSKNGSWSNDQLNYLGVSTINKGWKSNLIGKEIPDESIQLFLELKDRHLERKHYHKRRYLTNNQDYIDSFESKQIVLSEKILFMGMSYRGGWSMKQLRIFGIQEFRKGWKKRIIGIDYSNEAIKRFLALKNKHLEEGVINDCPSINDMLSKVNQDIPIVEQYENRSWKELRNCVLERDNYHCVICQNKSTELHVHHLSYPEGKFIWEIDTKHLITVCKKCHEKIHGRKLGNRNEEF